MGKRVILAIVFAAAAVGLAAVLLAMGGDDGETASVPTTVTSTTIPPSTTSTTEPFVIPAEAVPVAPGESLAEAVAVNPAGTAFVLRPGVHRLVRVEPKDGNQFYGEPGAVVNGAALVEGFVAEGERWGAPVEVDENRLLHGECAAGFELCNDPLELFWDDAPLRQVAPDAVTPDTWALAGNQVLVGADPTGHSIELAVVPRAFEGAAADVVIRGLTVEKYASPAQRGAIHGRVNWEGPPASGWIIEGNVIRLNNGAGVLLGDDFVVRNNTIVDNGQLGIGGGGNETDTVRWVGRAGLVEGNTISGNNYAGFDFGWEGGGTKFVRTDGLVVRGNVVADNVGPGLWVDIDNVNTTIEGNAVSDNAGIGIFEEISAAAVIRNNVVTGNGLGLDEISHWSAGIVVAASPDVEISGNTVSGNGGGIMAVQQDRGEGWYPREISNLWVHDNVVTAALGVTGLREEVGDDSYFESRNNRWSCNTYVTGDEFAFTWAGELLDMQGWQNTGNDTASTDCQPGPVTEQG